MQSLADLTETRDRWQLATENVDTSVFRYAERMGRLKASAIREILKTTAMPDVISFAGGLPAPELFPVAEFIEACREVFETDGAQALQYSVTEGYPELRAWIAAIRRRRPTPSIARPTTY